jgi:hypothetical protein
MRIPFADYLLGVLVTIVVFVALQPVTFKRVTTYRLSFPKMLESIG